jgi:N-acetylglucosamine kinase-like BadF-type ATPase
MSAEIRFVLGVDGGGTKTEACLAQIGSDRKEQILGRGFAGSSNVKAVGTETALANLKQAIDHAWTNTKQSPEPVSVAVFGLSGAGRPETQELIQEWARANQIAMQVRVVHDALPVLVAGTTDGVGVALIAGTGAVALAASEHVDTTVVGGWGYWFGDEGSAFWLGQAAARAATHAADGRSKPTLLTQAILDRLAISEPREILSALSETGDVRTRLAAIADLVTQCAELRDPIALDLLAEAGKHLASLVITAAERVNLGREFPLALAGGVVTGSTLIQESLRQELAARMIVPSKIEIVTNPVMGCIRLALRE